MRSLVVLLRCDKKSFSLPQFSRQGYPESESDVRYELWAGYTVCSC